MNITNEENKQHQKRCTVCNAERKGSREKVSYLGIDACRACYVFYSRVSANSAELKCRSLSGTESCKLNRDSSRASQKCPKCRYTSIQRTITKLLQNTESCSSSALTISASPEENESTYMFAIMHRWGKCFEELCQRRLFNEFGTLENLPIGPGGFVEAPITASLIYAPAVRQLYEEVQTFLEAASDEYAVMRQDYQALLFKYFMSVWQVFETSFRTVNYYPLHKQRIFVTVGHYMDVDQFAELVCDVTGSFHAEEDMKRLGEEYALDNIARWRPIMMRLKLTDEEFFGISAYILWNINGENIPQELAPIVDRNKQTVLHELHSYYRSKGVSDYSARLGEIFLLISIIEGMSTDYAKSLEMMKLLDVYDEDTYKMYRLTIE